MRGPRTSGPNRSAACQRPDTSGAADWAAAARVAPSSVRNSASGFLMNALRRRGGAVTVAADPPDAIGIAPPDLQKFATEGVRMAVAIGGHDGVVADVVADIAGRGAVQQFKGDAARLPVLASLTKAILEPLLNRRAAPDDVSGRRQVDRVFRVNAADTLGGQ